MIHPWEEPFLAGPGGSGAFFFTGCSLRCVFCQNAPISSEDRGRTMSPKETAERMIGLQSQGAENIDLVSPSHFVPEILEALRIARSEGLSLPVVWNSNAYELPSTLRALEGSVDVYLPDLKFHSPNVSLDLCGVADYFPTATEAVLEMHRQTGPARFADGLLRRGTVIRHLVLPGLLEETYAILEWTAAHLPLDTPVSLMRQYTPMHLAAVGIDGYPALSRRLTTHEYRKAVARAESLGFTCLWIQGKESASEAYTPDFLRFEGD